MSDASGSCAVVLTGGATGRVAPVLARLFGIDTRLAGQIAGAAPIVLVDNLDESQAAGVSAALGELAAAGAQLEVKSGSLGALPRVGWPGGPKINGRPAAEYSAPTAIIEGAGLRCPCCGAALKLVPAASGAAAPAPVPAAPAGAPAPRPAPAMAPMGKKDSGFEEIPLPDALKALATAPSELPDVPEVPDARPAKAPTAPAPAPVKGAMNPRQVKPGSSAPMALEEFEAGLASDDQMLADLDEGLPKVPEEKPRPVPIKPAAPRPQPLVEEITMAPEPPRAAGGPAKPKMVRPMTPEQAARQAVRPSAAPAKPPTAVGAPKPAAPPPPPAKPPTAGRPVTAVKPTTAVKSDTSFTGDPNEKVNIYINKTNNPKVHELIGKLHNISAEEAADLANKPLVTVARNISRQQAEIIKKKLAEYRVSARLSAARMSQRTEPEEGGEEEEGA